MKIACYTIAWNEEKILPYFINHYKQFCNKIVVYDNMSTDNTRQIALDSGCEVIQWSHNNNEGLNDLSNLNIKRSCSKHDIGIYDWVITVDADEFYTHKDGINSLVGYLESCKNQGVTLPKVHGFQMLHNDFNFKDDISIIKKWAYFPAYSKRCIFNPILDISWWPGCHGITACDPMPVEDESAQIILKHYKFINLQYILDRFKIIGSRISETNKINGWGNHYLENDDYYINTINGLWARATDVDDYDIPGN